MASRVWSQGELSELFQVRRHDASEVVWLRPDKDVRLNPGKHSRLAFGCDRVGVDTPG